MWKRPQPRVDGFHIFKTYYVDSIAWSYCGFMQQVWHIFSLSCIVFTLYLAKNDNKNKKIQSDSITTEIKQLVKQ
jgi:hypothetical protein